MHTKNTITITIITIIKVDSGVLELKTGVENLQAQVDNIQRQIERSVLSILIQLL